MMGQDEQTLAKLAEIRDGLARLEAGQRLLAEASLLILSTQRIDAHQREAVTGRIKRHFGMEEDAATFGP